MRILSSSWTPSANAAQRATFYHTSELQGRLLVELSSREWRDISWQVLRGPKASAVVQTPEKSIPVWLRS